MKRLARLLLLFRPFHPAGRLHGTVPRPTSAHQTSTGYPATASLFGKLWKRGTATVSGDESVAMPMLPSDQPAFVHVSLKMRVR